MTIDQHYERYKTHPDHLDALLDAITKRAITMARSYRHPDPEAFAQEAIIVIWQRWPLPVRKSFGGYVTSLIRRRLANDHRHRTRQRQIETVQRDQTHDVAGPSHRDDRDLSTITNLRRHKLAALLTLGFSVGDCAAKLGVSEKTVKRIARCPKAA